MPKFSISLPSPAINRKFTRTRFAAMSPCSRLQPYLLHLLEIQTWPGRCDVLVPLPRGRLLQEDLGGPVGPARRRCDELDWSRPHVFVRAGGGFCPGVEEARPPVTGAHLGGHLRPLSFLLTSGVLRLCAIYDFQFLFRAVLVVSLVAVAREGGVLERGCGSEEAGPASAESGHNTPPFAFHTYFWFVACSVFVV